MATLSRGRYAFSIGIVRFWNLIGSVLSDLADCCVMVLLERWWFKWLRTPPGGVCFFLAGLCAVEWYTAPVSTPVPWWFSAFSAANKSNGNNKTGCFVEVYLLVLFIICISCCKQ